MSDSPSLPGTLPIGDLLDGTISPVSWLIPDFIAAGSLVTLGGEPGAGKSYLSYSISLALTTSTPLLGWTIDRPRRILYIDQENSRADCIEYFRWAWRALGCPDPTLVTQNLTFVHFGLPAAAWAQQLAVYATAVKPDLIILDTTTPTCAIQDENDNGEASRAIMALRNIQALVHPAPAILALKHARVNSKAEAGERRYTLRGAKAWEGQADSVIFQIRAQGHPRTDGLTNTRLEPAKTRAFGLRQTIHIEPQWLPNRAGIYLSTASPANPVQRSPRKMRVEAPSDPHS